MTTWKSHQSSSFIDQSHQSQVPVSRDGCWPNISLSLILTHHHHPDGDVYGIWIFEQSQRESIGGEMVR